MIDNILDKLKQEYERAVYNAYADGRKEVEENELREALEVIRFYASNESWLCSMDSSIGDSITAFDYEENSSITKRRFVGGKRAREFLKKLEE